jgi:hypothetical protein
MNINPIGHLVKANPIQTQSKPVLSAVEWANLKRAKMDVNIYYTEGYENKRRRGLRKNKPNSNPNKPNFKPDDGFSAYYTRACHGLRKTLAL